MQRRSQDCTLRYKGIKDYFWDLVEIIRFSPEGMDTVHFTSSSKYPTVPVKIVLNSILVTAI